MISKIDAVIAQDITKGTAGLALAVIQNGEVIYANGHGLASLEWAMPVGTDTVFRWGSLTKTFTAMAIMLLADHDKLHPDDLITDYLPDYHAGGHDITIHHVLTHSAGVHSKIDFQDRADELHLPKSPRDFLDKLRDYPIEFKPNTQVRYSDAGYQLLGLIIERVAQMPYGEFIQTQIFDPLGMNRAYILDNQGVYPRYARGYIKRGETFLPAQFQNMSYHYSAGALGGTLDNLIIWEQALREKRLLSVDAYQHMFQATELADGTRSNYAYGWRNADFKGHRVLMHSGRMSGFSSYHVRLLDDDTSIILLSNWENLNLLAVLTKIAGIALDLPAGKQRPYILGGDALAKCVGRYKFDDGIVEFGINDAQILWKEDEELRLLPVKRNEFIFVDNPDARVVFSAEQQGVYTQVAVHKPFLNSRIAYRI